MICSACRIARQQLAANARRLAPTTSSVTATARRGICTVPRRAQPTSSVISSLPTVSSTLFSARSYSAAAAASQAASSPPPIPKPDFLDDAESHIWDLLVAAFEPHELSVRDISGGCGSMYGIEISSEKFRGANMLKQQRMVNGALGDLIKGWHGVQLKTRVPE